MIAPEVVVFTGPTLPPAEVTAMLDAFCAPPVSQGDVHRTVLLRRPWALAIIDGYFERVPAVWHKEILWALTQGVHVFGAASMGALRAAELERYGMVGVGAIFEAYRDGVLTDDDEVAVWHAPGDAGFRPMSEALVNIRATLAGAVCQRVLEQDVADVLVGLARGMYYGERAYPALFDRAAAHGVAQDRIEALRAWLPCGRVDQKAADARAMLRLIAERRADGAAPFEATFHFEHTEMWEQVARRAAREVAPAAEGPVLDLVLDELRLAGPERFAGVCERALARALGLEEADRQGVRPSPQQIVDEAHRLRRRRRLEDPAAMEAWLAAERLGGEEFVQLVEQEVRLQQVRALLESDVLTQLPQVLRLDARLGRLIDRALDKQQRLVALGLEQPAVERCGTTTEALLAWFFGERLGGAVPDDLDAYAAQLGCDAEALLQVLLREWCYWQSGGAPAAAEPAAGASLPAQDPPDGR